MRIANSVLKENEYQANKISARVMRITFLIFTLVYVLNLAGVFVVDNTVMTVAYVVGSILLLIPTLLIYLGKKETEWIKYLNVCCAILFVIITSITLTYHVVIVYVYGIAIASLYFSKKLNIIATVMTVAGVSAGQMAAFYLDTWPDKNFPTFQEAIIYGVVPRALILIAVAAIFTMLCNRTASLLGNLMGAKEQEEMLAHMTRMKEESQKVSNVMLSMVTELDEIAVAFSEANQSIAEEAGVVLQSSTDNAEHAGNVNTTMKNITERLTSLKGMSGQISTLSEQVKEVTAENAERMEQACVTMEEISDSTVSCRQVIRKLGEESEKIIGIVKVITGISNQTNILALNASIEAARAGEHGKGFAVVAGEIGNLSNETKQAVENIGVIISEVVKDTETAVKAMERSAELTQSGMENVRAAGDAAGTITSANTEMSKQVNSMDTIAGEVMDNGRAASVSIDQVSGNIEKNVSAVESVTAAAQENSAGTENLVEMVERIKELSQQLNRMVQA